MSNTETVIIEKELNLALGMQSVPVRMAQAGLNWAAAQLAQITGKPSPRVLVITDERVALHYGRAITIALEQKGFEAALISFAPGEQSKDLNTISAIISQLASQKFARDDLILALGGGVVSDVAGFVAAIYQRGINWVAVPTSLLGMVDAAIGGKTGVDHPLGKNLIGAFHQPLAVLIPFDLLSTLDDRDWISGSAEVVKAALLGGGELWDSVQRYGPNMQLWPRPDVHQAIAQAIEFKIGIVMKDEKESDLRRILNLGHTFGHALETVGRYAVFKHGEAVFLGLRAMVRLSEAMNLLEPAAAAAMELQLERAPFPKADIKPEALLTAIQRDKKVSASKLHWILMRGIGRPAIVSDVLPAYVEETARWLCAEITQGAAEESPARKLRVLVINGPNLNLLGTREPEIYGTMGYQQAASRLQEYAAEKNVHLLVRQSNLEGEIVDLIHEARHWADGIVINAGGYTHTSVAIRDALAAVTLPAIEVHLSDISRREDFRKTSLLAPVCAAQMMGQGLKSYFQAIERLIELNRDIGSTLGTRVQ
ncbi:MAG TPA: 3-dehydroquinate synthase [bacterium]